MASSWRLAQSLELLALRFPPVRFRTATLAVRQPRLIKLPEPGKEVYANQEYVIGEPRAVNVGHAPRLSSRKPQFKVRY